MIWKKIYDNLLTSMPNSWLHDKLTYFPGDVKGQPKKRPTGPMAIPSPEMLASMPLSPGVQFSRRRPSLGKSQGNGGSATNNNPGGVGKGRNTLDPSNNSLNVG